MDNQSGLFAVIPSTAGRHFVINEKEQGPGMSPQSHSQRVREVQVTGTAEMCCPADRVSVKMSVSSRKESVNEVTTSVSRRLEYILQSLR